MTSRSSRTARSRPAPSVHSRAGSDLPPNIDYWRDTSPLGAAHSSRNLQHMTSQYLSPQIPMQQHDLARNRYQSMAGLSMWGAGSEIGGPTAMPSPYGQPMPLGNPFDTPELRIRSTDLPSISSGLPLTSGNARQHALSAGLVCPARSAYVGHVWPERIRQRWTATANSRIHIFPRDNC